MNRPKSWICMYNTVVYSFIGLEIKFYPKKPKKYLCSPSGTKVMQTLVFGTGTVSANKLLAAETVSVNKPHQVLKEII